MLPKSPWGVLLLPVYALRLRTSAHLWDAEAIAWFFFRNYCVRAARNCKKTKANRQKTGKCRFCRRLFCLWRGMGEKKRPTSEKNAFLRLTFPEKPDFFVCRTSVCKDFLFWGKNCIFCSYGPPRRRGVCSRRGRVAPRGGAARLPAGRRPPPGGGTPPKEGGVPPPPGGPAAQFGPKKGQKRPFLGFLGPKKALKPPFWAKKGPKKAQKSQLFGKKGPKLDPF